jgi:hypothetical protein
MYYRNANCAVVVYDITQAVYFPVRDISIVVADSVSAVILR